MLITEKALIEGSGGIGRQRGGPGQRISFRVTGEHPVVMTIRHERVKFPPRGLLGGGPGAAGRDLINGQVIPAKGRYTLAPGDVASFETPGGGGFGVPDAAAQAVASGSSGSIARAGAGQ
jgi:N-methylhydantoinase B